MRPYAISPRDFLGRYRVALRERSGRGVTLGYVGRTTDGVWIAWPTGGEILDGTHRTRTAAAEALLDATTEVAQ